MSKVDRFAAKKSNTSTFVGPGSYNPDKAFKLLNDTAGGAVFSKHPANLY